MGQNLKTQTDQSDLKHVEKTPKTEQFQFSSKIVESDFAEPIIPMQPKRSFKKTSNGQRKKQHMVI